jgi:hypothetical protein
MVVTNKKVILFYQNNVWAVFFVFFYILQKKSDSKYSLSQNCLPIENRHMPLATETTEVLSTKKSNRSLNRDIFIIDIVTINEK